MAVAVAASACSLGALDGFSGGNASADAGDANDAAVDAPPDSGGPASLDAADAALAFSCDSGLFLFCTSFADPDVTKGWTGNFVLRGGTSTSSAIATSPPFAYRAALPAMADAGTQEARLGKQLTGAKPVRVSFDLQMPAPAFASDAREHSLMHVEYAGSPNQTYFIRTRTGSQVSANQNSTYSSVPSAPFGSWTRVALEVIPGSPGTIRLFYDGAKVFEDVGVSFAVMPANVQTNVYLGLIRYDEPGPAVDALYDNVTIEQIP
jgi:hypothetical protein